MKILHSVRGMANNISVFMYSVPQMAIVQYPEKSKIQALENILRLHACNFDISENRLLYIYGGRWLGTFDKMWDVNFCTVCGHLHIFNVIKFGNYVHIKLIR